MQVHIHFFFFLLGFKLFLTGLQIFRYLLEFLSENYSMVCFNKFISFIHTNGQKYFHCVYLELLSLFLTCMCS